MKRNPLILDTLFRCKDVEKAGTGFKRMNELCKENNVRWTHENVAYGFCFVFYRNNVQTNVHADVHTYLSNLKEKAIIERVGSNKSGYWMVLK